MTRREVSELVEILALRARGSRRAPRANASGGGDEDPGAAGAGRTAPLIPPPPVISGSAARRIEDAPDFL